MCFILKHLSFTWYLYKIIKQRLKNWFNSNLNICNQVHVKFLNSISVMFFFHYIWRCIKSLGKITQNLYDLYIYYTFNILPQYHCHKLSIVSKLYSKGFIIKAYTADEYCILYILYVWTIHTALPASLHRLDTVNSLHSFYTVGL